MATYDRRTTIDAPLADVWAFHSRVEGLEGVTPDWMGLRVESVIGPDGTTDPERLEAGTELSLSIRPFGVGPRQRWTSLITDRERGDGSAYFRDEMVRGPFDRWEHTHAFFADGERTVLRDHVAYELPGSGVAGVGLLTDAATPFSRVGFEAMFRTRHRLTKERLE
ncbi:SRPBCC family protein [Haloterrigena salinisoli]|uniref:SRPBCC family protein n=1 Tax=Haloterrigena salinisoli TaxID=3132747 RepID=UPI0030CCC87A